MSNKLRPEVETETAEPELVIEEDFDEVEIENLIPSMTVGPEMIEQPEKESIIKDETILGLYDEILDNCRKDREAADTILNNFLEMVMNEGDASSASKEAVVNLFKIKTDISDKMAKIADLETRMKLKEKDTFPRYLAAQQNNKVVIEGSKREMLKTINKLAQRKKNDK